MFVDEKRLLVRAGKGGDGAILFRKEKYVPRGGPDGGDGGNGGSVFLKGASNLHALSHLSSIDRIEAQAGQMGGHQLRTGKAGEDKTVLVPLGTQVFDGETLIGELLEENQELRIAKGGSGGWGNWRFRNSVDQVPHRANPGTPGEELNVRLSLQLIADVGLIGLPNAGKSTLLSAISNARPKVANYPFTTLEPQLGVVQLGSGDDASTFVVADLPGLIEGASSGRGLGTAFLKHAERTKTILHCCSLEQNDEVLLDAYRTIRQELESWSPTLGEKPELIVLTKADTVIPEELEGRVSTLAKQLPTQPLVISAAARQGLADLLTSVQKLVG